MKRITAFAAIMFTVLSVSFAKDKSNKHVELKGDFITVTYGQPAKGATNLFTEGKPWGTGVDEVATVKLDKGCLFADRQVTAGTYALVTVPFKGEWLVFLVTPEAASDISKLEVDELRLNHILASHAIINNTTTDAGAFKMELVKNNIVISWDKKNIVLTAVPF